jgi:predicted  nucleic acid-binding Zn-ribbon protein
MINFFKILFGITLIFITISCKTSTEKANEYFKENIDVELNENIVFITSTADFYFYANPKNYWYPEEYTFQDIMDDKFRTGYEKLSRLKRDIQIIPRKHLEISETITSLEKAIEVAQSDIKEKQKSYESLNSLWGMMMFGGTSNLLELDNLLSTDDERREAERSRTAIPKNVEDAFRRLTRKISSEYLELLYGMHDMEQTVFEMLQPNLEEKILIRDDLKSLVLEKIKFKYSGDVTIIEATVNQLFDEYDKKYKIKK